MARVYFLYALGVLCLGNCYLHNLNALKLFKNKQKWKHTVSAFLKQNNNLSKLLKLPIYM